MPIVYQAFVDALIGKMRLGDLSSEKIVSLMICRKLLFVAGEGGPGGRH